MAFILLMLLASLVSALAVWPLFWLVPLAAYAGIVMLVMPLRRSFRLWNWGRFSGQNAMVAFGMAFITVMMLIGFDHWMRPDVSHFGSILPVVQLGGVIPFAILFSILNAVCEEVIFRGILYDAAESQYGAWGAVLITGFLFGYGHRHGYPGGISGAVLAGFFGCAMGWLRARSGGLGLPILVHIVADATIFSLLVRSGLF